MEILVMHSNIDSLDAVQTVAQTLDAQKEILRWNVDIEDVDNVLRVVCLDEFTPQMLSSTIERAGYFCEELQEEMPVLELELI